MSSTKHAEVRERAAQVLDQSSGVPIDGVVGELGGGERCGERGIEVCDLCGE
jgi:hypothetical protein